MLERLSAKKEKPSKVEPEKSNSAEALLQRGNDYKNTLKLEKDIKREIATVDARKRNLGERVYSYLKKQGKQVSQIVAFMIALGLADVRGAEDKKTDNAQTGQKPTIEAIKTGTSENITEDQNKKVLEDTGIDIKKIAEIMGFNGKLEIPSKTGKYILHIGQDHYFKDAEKEPEEFRQIVDTQKKIEQGILALVKNGKNNIFVEGYTVETAKTYTQNDGKDIRENIATVVANKESFNELLLRYKKECEKYNKDEQGDQAVTLIGNIFKNRAYEIKKELEIKKEFSDAIQSSFKNLLSFLGPRGKLATFGENAIYALGATRKLETEGVIHGLPAETRRGNERVQKYNESFKKIQDAYFGTDLENLSVDDAKKIRNAYLTMKRIRDQIMNDNREQIALSLIKITTSFNPKEKIFIIVFGNGHDFKKMLQISNEKEPESQMGLISLRPNENTKP